MPDRYVRFLTLAVSGLAVTAVFFHRQVLSGFRYLFSDNWDGRIEIALLEHWFNALRGVEPWAATLFFHPAPATLGYNDGYFIDGVLYTVFRALGTDPFLSSEFVNIAVRLFGFFAFNLFATQVLRLRPGLSLLGAALFTLANNMFMQAVHAQLFSVSFAPFLAWLLCLTITRLAAGRFIQAGLAGVGAALFFDAWLMTSFYMAWFFALFAALCVLGFLLSAWADGSLTTHPWRRWLSWPPAAFVLAGLAGAAPFLRLYLPKAAETGMHPFAEVLQYTPTPLDLLHVGYSNAVFGWADRWLTGLFRPGFPDWGEHSVGFAPVILLLGLCGMAGAWRGSLQPRVLWRGISIAVALSLVLVLRIGDWTAWRLVYATVPGAGAIRVVSRDLIMLTFPVVSLAMGLLSVWTVRGPRLAAGVLAAVLLAEELNLAPYANIDRTEENQFLAAVPPAPGVCQSFFAEHQRLAGSPSFAREDAMLLAEVRRLPTLNGNASFLPPGALPSPDDPAYLAAVARYIDDRQPLDGLCALDLAAMRWDTDPLPRLERSTPVMPLGRILLTYGDAPAGPFLGSGWSGQEPAGRWSDGPFAMLRFAIPADAVAHTLRLELGGSGFVPPGGRDQVVTVTTVAGERLAQWQIGAAASVYAAIIPARVMGARGVVSLRLDIHAPISPRDAGMSTGDNRRLGIWITTLRLTEAADGP